MELFQCLRRAIRSENPLDLLGMVSGILEVIDPRRKDPFAQEEHGLSLGDLVEPSSAPYAEKPAALTVMRALVTDELTQARIARELESWRHPMPD